MNSKKKFILASILLILLVVLGINILDNNNQSQSLTVSTSQNQLPIEPIRGSFVVDIDNKNEVVGLVDYVFVARVVSEEGTIYKNVVTMEDENGETREAGSAYTNYKIEVLDNIKGNLKKEEPFEILKQGGISLDKKTIQVFEDDYLPEVNNSYIFLGYGQEDGSILISGSNSNILVNTPDSPNEQSLLSVEKEITASEEYKAYQDAFENQVEIVQRERFASKFEE
ncbi:hypothetical protein [Saccharibacillus endophyticus]|uniref:Cell surface protein n=1 Tax=Saccharibacillus endophyticus TaxID=2060666 RepID=A0ABQ1ZIP8_9BACL|nr:hypothetical protein [Saccharibacillus endophyticus]GGH67953.1 cell surface protein [Saccharibacillus endophyticus]